MVISSNDIYRLLVALGVSLYFILILAHYQTFKSIVASVKEGFPELIGK